MTALTMDPTRPAAPAGAPTRRGVTFPRVVASEWVKFRTLRSTVWTLAITVVIMAGVAAVLAWGLTVAGAPAEAGPAMGATSIITSGLMLAQLAVAVLGVLAVTGEYSTGMIRSTLAAVPRRLPALWAKALVVGVVVLVVGLVAVALSTLVTLPFHDGLGLTLDLGDGATLRILLGTALYLATIGLLAFAIGALLRHTAAALATVLGLLLVVESVFAIIPLRFFQEVSPFLPSTAGGRLLMDQATVEMTAQMTSGTQLGPWQGYGVMVAWVVVLLAAAAALLKYRDA